MQEESVRTPSYTVPCDDYVHVVEFSPFSSGTTASLLAYGGNQFVVVATCLFQVTDLHATVRRVFFPFILMMLTVTLQEEDMEVEGVDFNVLRAFHHDLCVDALAWSPESRLDRTPTVRYHLLSR